MFLRYLNFCPDVFGHVEKWLDKKVKVNLKIYDVSTWMASNRNTHIGNILRNKDSQTMKFGHLIEYNKRNIFFKSYAKNKTWELVPNVFLFFKNAL